MQKAARRVLVACAAAALMAAGCTKKSKWYDARVRIERIQPIRERRAGEPADIDVEFQYIDCPAGQQREIIRGDAEFARCIARHRAGDLVGVRIEHHWDPARVAWDWDVHEMAGCKRPPDPDDVNSFDTVQECESIISNGVNEGFRCNRVPQKALLAKCPWFGRR